MILRSTKKFFRKTFEAVRCFLSGTNYQKLPKDNPTPSPLFNSYSCRNYVNAYSQGSHSDLDKFYAEFSDHWDAGKTKKARDKKKNKSTLDVKERKEFRSKSNAIILHVEGRREDYHPGVVGVDAHLEARVDPSQNSKSGRNRRSPLVAKKLKELEMVDASNIDHVLDIEEVRHYYSLLTCPVYTDIVDNFFVEIYAELASATTLSLSHSTRMGRWTAQARGRC